jgi:hypothetical protein
MIVVGGVYGERCITPRVDEVFGSGGRAAAAIASTGVPVELCCYCPAAEASSVRASLEGAGMTLKLTDSSVFISFRYLHPLAQPFFEPAKFEVSAPIMVEGEKVLRFGFMEGDAIVTADMAVYDPQSPIPRGFTENGSSAKQLALILNSKEIRAFGPADSELDLVARLGEMDGANVIVVKDGAVGARVYSDGALVAKVPPYETRTVYKIGSGDIFSAAFAHAWMNLGREPSEAADYASRSAAHYVETRQTALRSDADLASLQPTRFTSGRQIYIAAPFFTTSDLWLVEELWRGLTSVGATPFSPYHDIGLGDPSIVAPADLLAVKNSAAVLAVVSGGDPGTLFEVGYAVSERIPVIALSENPRSADLTMLVGTGCWIADDLATAVYRAAWISWK